MINVLLNMGWGYYNYPSMIELVIVMFLTVIIEELILFMFCKWRKLNITDSILLMFCIFIANLITGITGYFMAFSGVG